LPDYQGSAPHLPQPRTKNARMAGRFESVICAGVRR